MVDGPRQTSTSRILPPDPRRSPNVAGVLPLLSPRGLSTGDVREALPVLLGPQAAGLSPCTITRFTQAWAADDAASRRRDLADRDDISRWADGIHVHIRLEDARLGPLSLIDARPDGTTELVADEDGYRQSPESWAPVLRDLRRRGMRAPVVAVGDGALGVWAAARDLWPETAEPPCWVPRLAHVLDKRPKGRQPRAKRARHAMMYAESWAPAEREIGRFVAACGAKYPKAVASLTADQARLPTVFAYPAAHRTHLRSTNPIESTFATVRLRERVTSGAGSPRCARPAPVGPSRSPLRGRRPCGTRAPGADAARRLITPHPQLLTIPR